MHEDLRRRALESGKTVSRKARTKAPSIAGSKTNSPAGSRANSRVTSRNASDDESEYSDTTQWSTNSLEDLLPEDDTPSEIWINELNERIGQITDRKRSSVQGREESLNAFSHILMAHYAAQHIRTRVSDLVTAILKSVKAGQTEGETVLALKALALILVTEPSDHIYDSVAGSVKLVVTDSQHNPVKVAAIHTLGAAAFYGGASLGEMQEIMDFFLEIVASDGHYVDAPDEADVVTAALEEWGFLATQVEEMEDASEEAMESFVEQLESSHVNVQISAGENIALLYEKSWTEREDDEEPPAKGDVDDDEEEDPTAANMVKRYTVYRQEHQLVHLLESLSKVSSKRISKKDKKSLHTNFADIANTVQHPTRGPRYNNAIDQETNKVYGSRMKVSIGKNTVAIDKWWKLIRLKSLRRILQGGFLIHYEDNEVVYDSLPLELDD
ncbi:hypothetical protein AAFC00_000984 [Neodothiora populina]|uniref:Interferon-related developmental regulator N-terminal domain-containing protein n=1 Tax=Neodothiora populina TaxID=2781224 RepID=A0ABR3PMG3_9PEZI